MPFCQRLLVSALGVRRQPFLAIGGFDAQLPGGPEDIDLCWRHALAGAELTVVANAVLFKRHADSFRSIFQQSRGYGRSGPLLYLKYRTLGMPRRSGKAALRHWVGAFKALGAVRDRAQLAAWVDVAGRHVGQVEGCIQGRVYYP